MNRFDVEPIWNFERKLKIMLNLCYLLHLFRILAITCCSKFQLIRDWCFLKGNLMLYNFYRNREIQILTFFWPKMRFNLLLKIMTFFLSIFLFFWNFHGSYLQNFFFFLKEQIRCHKEKRFLLLLQKKWKKMKSNQKSHLINFKLILVRTNQN